MKHTVTRSPIEPTTRWGPQQGSMADAVGPMVAVTAIDRPIHGRQGRSYLKLLGWPFGAIFRSVFRPMSLTVYAIIYAIKLA